MIIGHRVDTGDPTAVRKSSIANGDLQLGKTILEVTRRAKKEYLTYIKGTLYNRFGCNMELAEQ